MKRVCDLLKWGILCLLPMAIGFSSCNKDDDPTDNPAASISGVYILNQGRLGYNNAGITYYDETKRTTFDLSNGTLGDNAMDMKAYGSKIYITVSTSSVLTVLDPKTKSLIKRVELKNEKGIPREPRYLAFNAGKIYVSTFDGNVLRLDTVNYNVEAVAKVGPSPEGIAYVNGKLYVANSGGMEGMMTGVYGKTVSVVDVATFKEEKTITVGPNPVLLNADQYGDLYLAYNGNYDDVPAGFQRIDTKTSTVHAMENLNVSNFTIVDDACYFYGVQYDKDWKTFCNFGVFNVKTETLTSNPLISDGTQIKTAYAIGVRPDTQEVYISDTDYQNPGTIYVFGMDGKKINTIEAGINPCQFVFY